MPAHLLHKKILLFFTLFFVAPASFAQTGASTPETEQMYAHAQEYMDRGDVGNAIITYRQAILLTPEQTRLYTALGNALYIKGKYTDAEQALETALSRPDAGEESYSLMAAAREKQQNKKGAKAILKTGLARFPLSGLLYNELGNEYETEQNHAEALNAWLDGIAKEPAYAGCYYNAAIAYLGSARPLWGILYGTQYLYMAHDTTNDNEMKKQLFSGYKQLFDRIGNKKSTDKAATGTFESAVMATYTQLTPVISDGITTENLTMINTRFLMQWFASYDSKFPFPLFAYEDMLLRNGKFEISNEWLYGNAESPVEYKAWSNFHEGDMNRYIKWQQDHQLHPTAVPKYNSRNMDGLFNK